MLDLAAGMLGAARDDAPVDEEGELARFHALKEPTRQALRAFLAFDARPESLRPSATRSELARLIKTLGRYEYAAFLAEDHETTADWRNRLLP